MISERVANASRSLSGGSFATSAIEGLCYAAATVLTFYLAYKYIPLKSGKTLENIIDNNTNNYFGISEPQYFTPMNNRETHYNGARCGV